MPLNNLNFDGSGLLATGGKPSHPEDFQKLLDRGFTAIISLEDIPDQIISLINQQGLAYSYFDLSDFDSSGGFEISKVPVVLLNQICCRIRDYLIEGHTIYVHCSGGIRRSVLIVKYFLQRYDPEELSPAKLKRR